MKTINRIIGIMILCMFGFCTSGLANSYEAKKDITKSFKGTSNDYVLSVDHKYGSIEIKQWDKNEIYFDIKLRVEASSQSKADEILSKIDIKFEQTGKKISARTLINSYQCNNCGINLDFVIMVPKGIDYELENTYGSITMPDIDGNTNIAVRYGSLYTGDFKGDKNSIEVKYGNLKSVAFSGDKNNIDVRYGSTNIDKLVGKSNTISTSYGSKATIDKANKAYIDIKYSRLRVGDADELDIESGYNKNSSITKVQKVNLSSNHDSNYNIDEVDEIIADCGYTNITIGKLNKLLSIDRLSHGKLNIKNVSVNFELIDVDARYSDISINFDPKASYNVNTYARYGSISVPSGSKISKTEPERNSVKVEGVIGNIAAPKATVKIINNHANIDLRR